MSGSKRLAIMHYIGFVAILHFGALVSSLTEEQGMEMFSGLLLLVIGGFLYFLPAIIASSRGHRNATAIAVLNLFLGWTLLGWIGCIVWAFTNQK